MSTCSDCKFANKSGNEDFVFCTYWQEECNKSGMTETDFIMKVIFPSTVIQGLGLGWGYPKKHYKQESHWSYKGTATEGLMWNNQICVHKDELCSNFQKYGVM